MDENIIHVKIVTPDKTLFEDNASSVSSINSKGKFDILAQHANFITFIENKDIIIRVVNKPIATFRFPVAILYANNNTVNIYTSFQS